MCFTRPRVVFFFVFFYSSNKYSLYNNEKLRITLFSIFMQCKTSPTAVENPALLAIFSCSRKFTQNPEYFVKTPICNTIITISRKFCGPSKAKLNFSATMMLPMLGERKEQPTVGRPPSLLRNTVVVFWHRNL